MPMLLSTYFGWKDSSIMLLGLSTLMMASVVKINYNYAEPQNQYQYYTGSALFYASTTVVEASSMAIIAKTIPPFLALGYWNAGLLGGCAELLGRTLGNVSFTIYSMFDSVHKNRAEPFFAFVIDSIVIGVMLASSIVLYSKLSKHLEIQIIHEN